MTQVESRSEEVLLAALVLGVASVCRHLMEAAQRRAHVQLLRMTELEGRAQAGRLVDSRLNHLLKHGTLGGKRRLRTCAIGHSSGAWPRP